MITDFYLRLFDDADFYPRDDYPVAFSKRHESAARLESQYGAQSCVYCCHPAAEAYAKCHVYPFALARSGGAVHNGGKSMVCLLFTYTSAK